MTISYDKVLQYIDRKPSGFTEAALQLHSLLRPWDVKSLRSHLQRVGVIPEKYQHDSSEEKLYSKYCDMVVLGFLDLNGLVGGLPQARGNRADVEVDCRGHYRMVADAKAFRKSRTAKNPKDYKIGELNIWRLNAKADYACLVASQFPGNRSRIFREAVENEVCLLNFVHLDKLLANHHGLSCARLLRLWLLPKILKKRGGNTTITGSLSIDGSTYWQAVEGVINKL